MSPDPDLMIIVPTRGRPQHLPRLVEAWRNTGAFDQDGALVFVADADDPAIATYYRAYEDAYVPGMALLLTVAASWRPLVPKLNRAAVQHASGAFAVGFAGDDHVPRTPGWVRRYVEELRDLRTGIVYGDDLLQGEALPTQWAMTSDIVRALDCMVPSGVDHLYCDNVIQQLGIRAGCLRYLPDVVIEHMHPFAGKSASDEQYLRVNRIDQYRHDREAFQHWQALDLPGQAATVRALRERADA